MGLFDDLKEALGEMTSIQKKEAEPIKTRKRSISFTTVKQIDAIEIKNLRIELELSQEQLARVFNVTGQTIAKWEQGRNKPTGSSLRIFELLKNNPNTLSTFISK